MKWTNLKKKMSASSACQGPPRSIWVWLWPSWRVMMIRMMMSMVMMWLGKSFCHLAAYESGPLEEWSPPQWRKLFNIRTFVIRGQVFCCHSRSSAKLSIWAFFGSLRTNEAIPSAVAIHKLWRCRWYRKSTFEQILIYSLIIREYFLIVSKKNLLLPCIWTIQDMDGILGLAQCSAISNC